MTETVRIKYCGGCNPRYDRKAVAEKLRAVFPESKFVEMGDEGPFDRVVVLCGCPASCASHEDLQGKYGKIVTSSAEECEILETALKKTPD